MKLIIGNKNYSSWSLRPWLLLSVHGVPFEEIRIPLYREDSRAALSAYTDAGKVPVLHDGSLNHVLGTPEMASWYEHGAQETEVLEMSEVGA